MIRLLIAGWATMASAGAQVRQGGVYQIQSESLDSGGGGAAAGAYAVQQALPALGAKASGGAYSILSGFSGQLGTSSTGSGPAAFTAWQTAIFGGPAEPDAGPFDDPDGEGIPNLLEFAFNLSPLGAGTAEVTPGSRGGLPRIREESFPEGTFLTMEYIQRKNAGLFFPESSPQLEVWTPAAYSVLSGPVSVSPAYERMKLRLGAALQPGQKLFYRLAVIIQ